ncbi:GNAT family N-acetyltransferase [Actinocatenispora sera]|uniref:GNAT family N-acetyltransferase n=1 Tax=Actinocatenispora sera TaxID=390989 RepID=UPI00340A9ED6
MSVPIATAGRADADRLTRLLSDAFLLGDLADWLVPDLAQRREIYPRYWAIIARHALAGAATVDVTDAGSAAALWYAAGGGEPDLVPGDYDALLASACGRHVDRFAALDRAMHDAYPDRPGYAYLGFVGVTPERQRAGLGAALLDHRHRQLDRAGSAAFLIASSAGSARLYRRLGYRPAGPDIRPGPDAPALYPMLREPRPAT